MVQCGSCGNKWKQFPVGEVKKLNQSLDSKNSFKTSAVQQKIQKPKKVKKLLQKNKRNQFVLTRIFSKKHGIKINDVQPEKKLVNRKKGNFFWIL